MNKRDTERLNRAQIKEATKLENSIKGYQNHKKALTVAHDGGTTNTRAGKKRMKKYGPGKLWPVKK